MSVSGGVLNDEATFLPEPAYPSTAKAVRASGKVAVQVSVNTDGNVEWAVAVSGHPRLRKAAEAAARRATFNPKVLSGGQRVKVLGVLNYEFAMEP